MVPRTIQNKEHYANRTCRILIRQLECGPPRQIIIKLQSYINNQKKFLFKPPEGERKLPMTKSQNGEARKDSKYHLVQCSHPVQVVAKTQKGDLPRVTHFQPTFQASS